MRALLATGVLVVASCGLGVTENLSQKQSLTDGPSDVTSDASSDAVNDATIDVSTDGPGDLATEGAPVDAVNDMTSDATGSGPDVGPTDDAGAVDDAGRDDAEDVRPDDHATDAPGDGGEPDVAQDGHEADVADDGHEADGGNDGREAGVEGGTGDGGTSPSSCKSSQPFGTPTLVPVLNPGGNLRTARLSPDERVAYLAIDTGELGIFVSVRANRFDPFGTPTPLSAVNDRYTSSPSATANGLTLFLESTRASGFRVFKAERSFLGAEFSKPVLVTDLGAVPTGGPFVTPEGGALYFHSLRENTMDLYRAVNNGAGFDPPVRLAGVSTDGADEYLPVVTPDELTIFYLSSAGMLTASRESVDLPFGPPVTLVELDTVKAGRAPSPAWVSPDGCRLYYLQEDNAATGRLYAAERLPTP